MYFHLKREFGIKEFNFVFILNLGKRSLTLSLTLEWINIRDATEVAHVQPYISVWCILLCKSPQGPLN